MSGGGKEGGRAPGKGRGASGARRVAGQYLPTSFPFGRPALPAGPAARAANEHARCSGCEPRVGGLESEGRRRSLIGPASPVEREARRGRAAGRPRTRRGGTPTVSVDYVSGALPREILGREGMVAGEGKARNPPRCRPPVSYRLGPGPPPRSPASAIGWGL